MPKVIFNINNTAVSTNQPNGLVSGRVEWLTGLTFLVTSLQYYIDGFLIEVPAQNITLQDADVTHGRIDVFIADQQGNVGVLTGMPGVNPIKPEINPLTQIELTFVLIPANATQPDGITANVVYAENAGTPNEWATASNGGSVTFDNTADPAAGTNAIAIQNYSDGDTFTFTNTELVSTSNLFGLKFKIKNAVSQLGMLIRVYNGTTAISGEYAVIFKIDSYGYTTSTTGYQDIVIPASDFGFTDTQFDKIEFKLLEVISSPSNSTHYIDALELVYDQNIEVPFRLPQTHYITLSNVVDLKELILIDNPIENDIAIISNYLNDVVNFRYINNGWQRESTFNVGCGVRVDETNQKFYMIDDDLHAPLGVRYVVTDPFGNGSFQFALMCPNADNITGTFIGTSDESDGLRGYTIGGSVGGRIGIMRVSAVNGFPIIVDIDSGTGVVTFRDVASNNIPSSYFSYTYVESSGAFTINHPDIAIQKNIAPTVTPRSFISAGRGLLVTDFTNTSVEIKLGASSTLASFPSFTVYRNGTYIVPIDLMKSSGNYIFTGQTRSTERLYAVALNNDNIMSLDQDSVNSGEFTVEFGFRVSADQTQLMTGGNGANFITVGGFSSNILRIAIGGFVLNTSTFVSLDEDHFLRLRRDTADNVYLKLDDNDEIELENTSGDFTITDIGHRSGFTANRLNGYIRNLRLGNEYYNFSEQKGLTGASVYNSGGNPRTFTLTQGDVGTPMWIKF